MSKLPMSPLMKFALDAWSTVDGYKSYIFSGAVVVVVGLYLFDQITIEQAQAAIALLGAGAAASLRSAIKKVEDVMPEQK